MKNYLLVKKNIDEGYKITEKKIGEKSFLVNEVFFCEFFVCEIFTSLTMKIFTKVALLTAHCGFS